MDYALWLSGSPFTVREMEEEDIQPQPPHPTTTIQSSSILVPVTPPAWELLPSPFPQLFMPAMDPEPVPMPAKDPKPELTTDPEPKPAESDQVCRPAPMS